MTLTPQQAKLIDDLANDFAPIVKEIEASIATTKNHYGRYGALLSSLSKGNKVHAKVFSLALTKAGANVEGVTNGFNLFC
jgi:hypothetical protein